MKIVVIKSTLNVDRMRRHVARNTPDKINEIFEGGILSEDERRTDWIDRFEQLMAIKHNKRVPYNIVVTTHPWELFNGNHYKVVAEYKEITPQEPYPPEPPPVHHPRGSNIFDAYLNPKDPRPISESDYKGYFQY